MIREAAARRGQPITEFIKDAVRSINEEDARRLSERYARRMAATDRFIAAIDANPPTHDLESFRGQLSDDVLIDNGLERLVRTPQPGVREERE